MLRSIKGRLSLGLLIACSQVYAQTDTLKSQPMVNPPVLERFRALYNNQQFDSLYPMLDTSIQKQVGPEAWKKVLAGQVWPNVGIVGPIVFDRSSSDLMIFIANSESKPVGLQLVLGRRLLVQGFRVVQPKNASASAPSASNRRPQTPVPPFPYNSEDVEYDNAGKDVHFGATFTYPRTSGPFTTVLLITGSGIQDRDETILGHKPFAVLADYLTRNGYAVLRVDDRGAGKTKGDIANATSADFAGDVEAGLDYLETRKEVNRKKIGLLGHSEGGVIAPMVAAQRKDVDFIILWGAPMIGGAAINAEQNKLALSKGGFGPAAADAFVGLHSKELAAFPSYKDTAELHAGNLHLFDEWKKQQPDSILHQLNVSGDQIVGQNVIKMYNGLYRNAWMRYFLTHDYAGDLAKVHCKVLAINGEKDTQVEPGPNLAEIRQVLQANGNKSFTIVELKGLNHLLQTAGTGDFSEYANIQETIAPAALGTIGNWLDKTVGK